MLYGKGEVNLTDIMKRKALIFASQEGSEDDEGRAASNWEGGGGGFGVSYTHIVFWLHYKFSVAD